MKSVLVIEHDGATRGTLHDLLKLEWPHVSVLTAENGPIGLALAQELRPDLIFLEGEIPGMDGYQTAKALRRMPETRLIPLIAITSTTYSDVEVMAGLANICNGWLLKPLSANKLVKVVAPFTSSHRSRARMAG